MFCAAEYMSCVLEVPPGVVVVCVVTVVWTVDELSVAVSVVCVVALFVMMSCVDAVVSTGVMVCGEAVVDIGLSVAVTVVCDDVDCSFASEPPAGEKLDFPYDIQICIELSVRYNRVATHAAFVVDVFFFAI